MDIFDKKVSRKEFIWSAASVLGVIFLGNLGSLTKGFAGLAVNNHKDSYGNSAYGGITQA